jgi:hypothetical protein
VCACVRVCVCACACVRVVGPRHLTTPASILGPCAWALQLPLSP